MQAFSGDIISHVLCIDGRREIKIIDLFQRITLQFCYSAVEISFSQNMYSTNKSPQPI